MPTDADGSCIASCGKAIELTELLWPWNVCMEALQSSFMASLIRIQLGSSLLDGVRIGLRKGWK